LIKADRQIKGAKVTIFGLTFKENCPDVRNTKVIDIIKELEEYGVQISVVDPAADENEVWHEYNIKLCNMEDIKEMDALIFAVPHEEFKALKLEDLEKLYSNHKHPLIDVKGIFDKKEAEAMNYLYWRL